MTAPPLAAGHLPDELTTVAATAIVGFAALVIFMGSLTSVRAGRHAGMLLATYLGIGLEFFLAAGLIRLAAVDTSAMLGVAAAIIAVRRAIVVGLKTAARVTA